MVTILSAHELYKKYNDFVAVNCVSFKVNKGDCFGLLGSNGAGKTTTIEMIEGILSPNSGSIYYQGQSINKAYKQVIGIQFQHTALPEFLTTIEALQLFASFYNKSIPIDQLVFYCRLQEFISEDIRYLSGGSGSDYCLLWL